MSRPTPLDPKPPMHCHTQAAVDAQKDRPNKKKIFVFCDGTGNEFSQEYGGGAGNSNVVKLYTALRVADDQVAYYHPGVGTMGNPAIRYSAIRFWSKVKGLAFGAGFRDNVLDAYRYLMDVYNDGDEIYLFGFSRGAYTARALAGMLYGYGLLCRGNEGHILYAWKMLVENVKKARTTLKQNSEKRGKKAGHRIERNHSFAETYSRKVTVRFMGVWDTVSSVGWIYTPLRLLDMAQNPIVQVGRHAISIDERRAFYRDNLWGRPVAIGDGEWPEELRDRGIHQDIAQVWFPGMHSDVGGSYPQREAAPANEALAWMIGELQQHGAQLCEERVRMVLGKPSGVYDADRIYTLPKPDHCLHESLTGKWWLLQLFPQQYYSKEDDEILWRVPYGTPRALPNHSVIHGSAVRRMNGTLHSQQPYRPRNLKLEDLHPIQGGLDGSNADVTGCYLLRHPKQKPSPKHDGRRLARLAVGWVTFAAFWAVIFGVLWYVLGAVVLVAKAMLWLLAHTPGLRGIG